MAKFDVDVGGATYEVDAPDENTAWKWANATHAQSQKSQPAPNYSPTEEMSGTQKFLAGAGKGMTDIARGAGQLLGLVDQQSVDEAKARDASLMNTGAGIAGNIAGNLAVTAVPGAGIGNIATRGAAAVLPAAAQFLAPTVGAAVSGGAVAGATTPVASGESRADVAQSGAMFGAVGDAAARGLARVVQPLTQSSNVKKMLAEGIVPTPGQAAGANSFLGKIEQRLQSIPLVGDLITGGRNRATQEFNEAALNRALPAGSDRLKGVGREALQKVDEVLSQGYDDVLSSIKTVSKPQNFDSVVKQVVTDPDISLTKPAQTKVLNMIRMQFSRPGIDAQTGAMSGELAKRIDSTLGRLVKDNLSSASADDRAAGFALRKIQESWRGAIRAAAPDAETGAKLDALNKAYANFVRVERAAGSVGAKDGVFSASQLQSAVKALDRSPRKGDFAQGAALMQDLTDPAVNTLAQTVPNSGTVDRALNTAMFGGGAAAAGAINPMSLAAIAAAPLAYTRTGSRYMIGDIAGQQTLAELLRNAAPYAGQAGRAFGTQ